MLANHWFRDVNDVRSEPMGFQIQMPLEPKGKPSSPFTKPHSSFECRRESIYWSVRAHCILLGLKSETCFFSPLWEARHLYGEFNPHSSNIYIYYTAFTEISVWKRLFCAARKFIVGLQLQIQLFRLGGKRTPFSPREGLYCLATILMHEVFPVILCALAVFTEACALSISDIYRWGRCSLNSVWFCEWRSLFSPLTDRVSLHWEKQEAVRGLRVGGGPLLISYIYFKHFI